MNMMIEKNDFLVPDGWNGWGANLEEGDAQTSYYIGSQFRVEGRSRVSCPVNVQISGRVINWTKFSKPAIRVRIEWVRDGEPSDWSNGWLVLKNGQV